MARKLRWGVIGSGGIALRRTIPEGIAPASNAELVAVYDINDEVNRRVAERFGAAAVSSVGALLAAEVEAVYIATPVAVHTEQALACAAAGKHVLCEKPLGMNVAEAEAMARACEQAGVELGVGLMMRFHAQHQAALGLIREGALGRITYARAQLSCWYPPIAGAWRQTPSLGGGGSLMDMGGHCLDLLEMLLGPIVKLCCFTGNTVHGYESEDSAVVMMSFASGAMATVDAFFSITDSSSKNALEIYGTNGGILAKGTIGQGEMGEMAAFLNDGAAGYAADQKREPGGGIVIAPEPVNMYRAEIEAFGQAVLDGRPAPAGADIGLRSQRVLAACYESARTGNVVEL